MAKEMGFLGAAKDMAARGAGEAKKGAKAASKGAKDAASKVGDGMDKAGHALEKEVRSIWMDDKDLDEWDSKHG